MSLSAGEILNNRYRIVKMLGEGGFGAVYRAWDIQMQGPCAVKENLDTSPAAQSQFVREARLLYNLRHPNLPRVFDHFTIPGQGQYLVMDFIDGEDLQTMLTRAGGPLPEAQVLGWIGQVCDALIYLHAQNPPVIHRDIKPANIRITPQGQAMLVDFGIAKLFDPNLKTTLGARAVTPGYSPPEQYGKGSTDAQSDVYALGATVYHLLTGQEPATSMDIVSGVATPPRPANAANPEISPQVSAVLEKAMQIHRSQRLENVAAFKAALAASLSAGPAQPAGSVVVTTQQVTTAGASAPPGWQALPRWTWGLAAAALIGIVLGVIALTRQPQASLPEATPTVTRTPANTLPSPSATSPAAALPPTATLPPTRTPAPTNTPPPALPAVIMDSDWPMFGHDASRTSWNAAAQTLYPPLQPMGAVTIEGYVIDDLSAAAGMIFLSGDSNAMNTVYALADGSEEWNGPFGTVLWDSTSSGVGMEGMGAMSLTPAYLNGRLFFGGQRDNYFYAVHSANGELIWKLPGVKYMFSASPLVFKDKVFAFGSEAIYKINPADGAVEWLYAATGPGQLAAWENTLVALSAQVIAIDIATGQKIWQRDDLPTYWLRQAVVYDERVYLGSKSRIWALDLANGETLWSTPLFDEPHPADAEDTYSLAYANGIVVAAGIFPKTSQNPEAMYRSVALDALSGEILWYSDAMAGQPVIANGVVYLHSVPAENNPCSTIGRDLHSGAVLWELPGYCGNMVIANNLLFMLANYGRDGLIVLGNQP